MIGRPQQPSPLSPDLLAHFALGQDPFAAIATLPAAFLSAGQRDCYERLATESVAGNGFAVVTGAAGIGKTTLLETVRRTQLHDRSPRLAVIEDPRLQRTDVQFLRAIVRAIGGNTSGRTGLELTSEFGRIGSEVSRVEASICLLVDDAHTLTSSQLEAIRTLTGQAQRDRHYLFVALIGEPSLRDRIQRKQHLADTVSLFYSLNPVSRLDTAALLENRVARAGYSRPDPLFTNGAIARMHALSRGTPSDILQIASLALIDGFQRQIVTITESDLRNVVPSRVFLDISEPLSMSDSESIIEY